MFLIHCRLTGQCGVKKDLSFLVFYVIFYLFLFISQIDANDEDFSQPLKEYILFTDAIKVIFEHAKLKYY